MFAEFFHDHWNGPARAAFPEKKLWGSWCRPDHSNVSLERSNLRHSSRCLLRGGCAIAGVLMNPPRTSLTVAGRNRVADSSRSLTRPTGIGRTLRLCGERGNARIAQQGETFFRKKCSHISPTTNATTPLGRGPPRRATCPGVNYPNGPSSHGDRPCGKAWIQGSDPPQFVTISIQSFR